MKNKNLILTAALAFAMVSAAQAQDERGELKSYSYVEAQGGLQLTSTDASMTKLMTPTAAISFGHYFTPVVGARLHINAWQAKSGFSDLEEYYKWKYITPDLDLMLNLSNMFCSNQSGTHALNVILLGGVGLNYAWDNDELKDMKLPAWRTPLAWDKNRLSHNLRAGLRLETNVTKPLGLSLEVNANSLSDRFNSKSNDADDWQFTAMLGLSFRFGHKYSQPAPKFVTKLITVIDTVEVDEPYTYTVKEKRPIEKMEKTKIDKVVYFDLAKSNANNAQGIDAAIKDAADLIKTSPDTKITVVGYADKGTGTAATNKRLAKERAESVAKKLIKEHGIDANSITVDSKGDTVQPFEENDKNRCVIITGEGTFKVTSYEEYDVEKQGTRKVQKYNERQVEIQEQVQ